MNTLMTDTMTKTARRRWVRGLTALALVGLAAGPAAARDNERYGETRINKLPLRGTVSKDVWVGSWWAYGTDGISYRVHDSSIGSFWGWETYAGSETKWDNRDLDALSPAEKYDHLAGRADKIDYDALKARALKVHEVRADVKALIDKRREVIRKLNKLIEEHRGDYSFDWAETDEGKEYKDLGEQIDAKEKEMADAAVDVDTAFEWEVMNHGGAQFNVEGWYGHCNAWSAAAIMEPEPRHDVTVDGVTFTPGDIKAYLTELWMEQQSTFYGTRNEYDATEEAREDVSYKDVTPAAFHIFFADQIGNRDRGFVIDRYTGSQVWNQPVKSYRSKIEPLYEGEGADAKPLTREITYTTYGYRGAKEESKGEQEVYPVLVTTTIHWVTDGLPAETLTVDVRDDDIDDETFASAWRVRDLYDDQVELRTLTYELWLDKPLDDPEARIIGDGKWEHGSLSGYEHLHPDFMWQPTANVNNSRDYENPYLDYQKVTTELLAKAVEPKDDPTVEPGVWTAEGPVDIPDADKDHPATLSVTIDDDLTVGEMTMDVDITHTYIADLQVRLRGPDGRTHAVKHFGSGGSADDIHKTYDLKKWNGTSALGTWTLEVRDQWKQDTGTLDSFTLHIK